MLTAIGWLIDKQYEEKAFSHPREGLIWGSETIDGVDVGAALADIRAELPHGVGWLER